LIGLNPSAMSITALIAIGVPKPARASISAKAEGDDHGLDALVVRDRPERAPEHREVARGDRHVVDPDRRPTIHMIGKMPKAAPRLADSAVWSTGMPYTINATSIDTPRAISATHCAFILNPPRSTNRQIGGSAAKIAGVPFAPVRVGRNQTS
jgi:hypothetical protein